MSTFYCPELLYLDGAVYDRGSSSEGAPAWLRELTLPRLPASDSGQVGIQDCERKRFLELAGDNVSRRCSAYTRGDI